MGDDRPGEAKAGEKKEKDYLAPLRKQIDETVEKNHHTSNDLNNLGTKYAKPPAKPKKKKITYIE